MLRPKHLQKIDSFIDNLNIVKLFDRFKKEEDDPKSVEEYDSMYGDPDEHR